ncbi:hypothetical protein C0Q70_11997 [Pomacea canaliculata]|uniref:Glucuronosyltransferase n=1 Tax=Pomacea canaliculata TaxID=400727 RepID=A0A2T7P0A5_POMCA|nr:hypothetical protein C0Q70_11997 [Pomacea canaliculata]
MPSPFTSHTNYHTNVARTLARQGHEVWLTMPDYLVNRRVLDTTNLTVIEYQTLINFEEMFTAAFPGNYFKGLSEDWNLPFKSVFRSNISSPNSKKILTSSWIPQNDLLAHPNTRVFVSHCGNDGQYEALFHAVPVGYNNMFDGLASAIFRKVIHIINIRYDIKEARC